MKESIIVDTSVWIDFFNGKESDQVKILVSYIQEDDPIYLCPTIIQEVLQGISNDSKYKKVKEYLLCFNVLNDDSLERALGAAELFRKLRKKGVTIRKSNDCLIAEYAYKYNLNILHSDRDFDLITQNY